MKCQICGKEIDHDVKNYPICFNCHFWKDVLEEDSKRPPHTWCMIDGTHYVIEPDNPRSYFQGFGGAKFQIEFNDGFKVVTHNLWCQGEPEEVWKEKFPNNAKFENNLKWKEFNKIKYLVEE